MSNEHCVVNEIMASEIEILAARYEACYRALSNLVAYIKRVDGFMYPADQLVLRDALLVLAEGVTP